MKQLLALFTLFTCVAASAQTKSWLGTTSTIWPALSPTSFNISVGTNTVTINNTNTAGILILRLQNQGTNEFTFSSTGNQITSGSSTAASFIGPLTGNATTASTLATPRTINGVSFDGSGNITVTAAAGTLSGSTLAAGVTGSSLTSVGTLGALTVTAPITGSVTGSSGSTTGNAATATALQTPRTINGTSFDGTANITVTAAGSTLSDTVTIGKGGTGQTTGYAAKDALSLKGADIASATTTDLSAATGDFVDVTGTTTITALGTSAAGVERTVRFTGALTLTHNATSLILPGAVNITTVANDRAIFRSLGSGNWLCVDYVPATVTGTGSQVRHTSPTFSGNVIVGGNITIGASNPFIWIGLSRMTAPSDGTIQFNNSATTGFTKLQLGPDGSAPTATTTLTVGSGSGTNIAGSNLSIDAGKPTGSGTEGTLVFRTAPTGTTGTNAGTLATRLTLSSASALFTGVVLSPHYGGSGSSPTIVTNSGAGTSAATASLAGTDAAGQVTINSGLTPAVNAAIVTITFATAYTSAPYVVLWPAEANAATLGFLPYVTSTTGGFTVNNGVALGLVGSTTYKYNFHVIQ